MWGSTLPTIILYSLEIIFEFIACRKRAKEQKQRVTEQIWKKKWFFLRKFSEFPMLIHYLDL